ncbi:hypothetical protein F4694_000081 [Bacillus niacini]|uniref:Uncharacterized protein n=1 Tax=Neobacillus niacini TaxID=86668 RepID=A0A852T3V8_9BACI|nr:hypothetical protein [Neobacillus niacini]
MTGSIRAAGPVLITRTTPAPITIHGQTSFLAAGCI